MEVVVIETVMISQSGPKNSWGTIHDVIIGLPLDIVWNFRILRHRPNRALVLIKRSSAMERDMSLSLVCSGSACTLGIG